MKNTILLLFLFFFVVGINAQEKVDKKLQGKLNELVREFNGEIGIYIKNLITGRIATVNQDTIFSTAIMVKIPITCGIFNK